MKNMNISQKISKVWMVAACLLVCMVAALSSCKSPAPEEKSEPEVFDRDKATLLKIVKVEYRGSLAPQGNNTYEAINLCDGNNATAWAISLDKVGIYDDNQLQGPVFTVNCKKLSHIIIRNGYCKSTDAFKNNTRAAKISFMSLTDDKNGNNEHLLFYGFLKDEPTPQRLDVPLDLTDNNNVTQIRMDFNTQINGGYYPGRKWNDLCISEVEFWGFE